MTLTNGLVVMTPTTVAKTGASSTATINSDGSVTFGLCETLSLNGVFTSAYDNYKIYIRYTNSTSAAAVYFRLRSGGVDQSSGTYYDYQGVVGDRTYFEPLSASSQNRGRIGNTGYPLQNGDTIYLFGPYIAASTAIRNVHVGSQFTSYLLDFACYHALPTSYDGITLIPDTPTSVSGLLTVFGFNQ